MHKGLGRAQQIRGHKRKNKVIKMKSNRNPNSVKPFPGEKYLARVLNNEQ